MEQAYHSAVAAQPGCHGTSVASVEEPVSASANKRAKISNPYEVQDIQPGTMYNVTDTMEQIRSAYSSLKGRGSVVDSMKAVANIIPQQRRNGFR
jgi:hypothetical protein